MEHPEHVCTTGLHRGFYGPIIAGWTVVEVSRDDKSVTYKFIETYEEEDARVVNESGSR